MFAQQTFGPGMKRLPWMYRHDCKITSSLEKFVFLLLGAVLDSIDSPSLSTLSAWGDLNPVVGARAGSAEETVEAEGVRLIDPDRLPPGL
jgi:hypothetical protein